MSLFRRSMTAVIALHPGIFDAAFCTLLVFGRRNDVISVIQLPVPTLPPGGGGQPYKAQRRTAEATATEILRSHGYQVAGIWQPGDYATQATVKKVKS